MNTHVTQTLAHIIGRFGADIVHDIRKVEALLRDLHPESEREVAVLVEALSSGVVTRLRVCLAQTGGDTLRPIDRDDLIRHLTESAGISGRFALWAVDAWLEVLGVEAEGIQALPVPRSQRASIVRDRPGTLDSVLGRFVDPATTVSTPSSSTPEA